MSDQAPLPPSPPSLGSPGSPGSPRLPWFDPRQVPVVSTGAHLPAVPSHYLSALALRLRFTQDLPWQVDVLAERPFTERASSQAAVLIAVVMRERPTLLLTQRTLQLSTHAGQIAFPGGKRDEADTDAACTALREAHEEIGLEARHVEVLGALPTYVTGTAFVLTPVVALVTADTELKPNADEVSEVFEVPLDFLMNPTHHRKHRVQWEGVDREWFSMPYNDAGVERFIWGATAGMLRNLYRFLAASQTVDLG